MTGGARDPRVREDDGVSHSGLDAASPLFTSFPLHLRHSGLDPESHEAGARLLRHEIPACARMTGGARDPRVREDDGVSHSGLDPESHEAGVMLLQHEIPACARMTDA